MKRSPARHERRGRDRPAVGDTKPCSACTNGTLEFTERYRSFDGKNKPTHRVPAWVCDVCPRVIFVRAANHPDVVRSHAREARAHANRKLMKARFVRAKANRALQKSQTRRRS